jgi:serine/threonine-protein kinase HipA
MMREIFVFGDWQELRGPQRVGVLRSQATSGKEIFSFEYDPEWQQSGHAFQLDPELQLFSGPQYSGDTQRPNFGMFLDSSPDRWGQLIMRRREARDVRRAGRKNRVLTGTDFLLGVHDEQRLGGLRFKLDPAGAFIADEPGQTAPPWVRLRELENAAWRLQSDETLEHDQDEAEWLNLLLAPGSSLGGTRPKAGVCDEKQDLWIAKFPGRNDLTDVGAWELVTHRLAHAAGLNVSEATALKLGQTHHTFIVKRFDRVVVNGERRRRHFASAMTMLGYADGTSFKDGASYLEIVEFLMRYGADTDADLHELWRRIVFSICVSNTDDHLRNHGFLLQPDGWRLSPAFDLNPDPQGNGLSLNVSEDDNSLSLDLAREVAAYFRLDDSQADSVIDQVQQAVAQWRAVALEMGIPRGEQELMRRAFHA